MEMLRIVSLSLLLIMDIFLLFSYILACKDEDKTGRNVVLVLLTIFILPTIYIVLN
jgi:hypothetical protein